MPASATPTRSDARRNSGSLDAMARVWTGPIWDRPNGKRRTSAEAELIGWLAKARAIRATAPPWPKPPIYGPQSAPIAGGFAKLTPEERAELLEALPLLFSGWQSDLLSAVGAAQAPELEPYLAAYWAGGPTPASSWVEDRWIRASILVGRGHDVAVIVRKLRQFARIPLVDVMAQTIRDYPADEQTLDLLVDVWRPILDAELASDHSYPLNLTKVAMQLAAYLMDSGKDAYVPLLADFGRLLAPRGIRTVTWLPHYLTMLDTLGGPAAHTLADELRG